jgi:cold-inducible RNA-binding protein
MPMSLYIGNLNFQTSENQLVDLFAPFGAILSVRIPLDRESRRPRGFAFVEMECEDALRAAEALNNGTYFGRTLTVIEAMPKPASHSGRSNFTR